MSAIQRSAEIIGAVERGDFLEVERLIDLGVRLDVCDDRGWTALHHAAAGGHLPALKRLLEAHADPNARNHRGETPLHRAAACGSRVRWMMTTSYGPDGSARRTETIDVEDVERLTTAGAEIDAEDRSARTPLMAALNAEVEECALALIELGASATRADYRGYTPLHFATLRGLVRAARQLLDHGADPNAQSTADFTPLDGAIECGQAEMEELLRVRGAWRTHDSPGGARDWIRKGVAAAAQGNREEAMACFDRALQENPFSVEAWIQRGEAEHHFHECERALECFDKAIAIDPTHSSGMVWGNKGCTLQGLGYLDEAATCYERVLEINPRDARAWTNIGTVRNRQGRKTEAMEAYRTALDIDPNERRARVYLDALTRRS